LVSHFEEGTVSGFLRRVLRRICGPKREEDGSWRKLHNDELYGLYSSSNIVSVIKSKMWVGNVARMGEVFTGFWFGGPMGIDHWEDLGIGVRITLRWILAR
jgi:hypothetical protein